MSPQSQIIQSLSDLCRAPQGARDRQLLFGDGFTILERAGEWCFGRATKDGYQGYIKTADLAPYTPATHWVSALSSHAYAAPNLKSPDQISLPFGAQVTVSAEHGDFFQTPVGFIPRQHLRAADDFFTDPREVAKMFLGSPYLWGRQFSGGRGLLRSGAGRLPCHGARLSRRFRPATGIFSRNRRGLGTWAIDFLARPCGFDPQHHPSDQCQCTCHGRLHRSD